jgi:hypothetical protein
MADVSVPVAPGVFRVVAPPRPDGYRPIADACSIWGGFLPPAPEPWRFVLSAARRCDSAHLLIQRVREGIEAMNDPKQGPLPWRRKAHEVIGDAEAALTAMHRAVAMSRTFNRRFYVTTRLPESVAEKAEHIRRLRDAYEHIEERAVGNVRRLPDPDALSAFAFQSLFERRTVTYGGSSLSIDQEATGLLIALRDYIWASWLEVCAPSAQSQPSNSTG